MKVVAWSTESVFPWRSSRVLLRFYALLFLGGGASHSDYFVQ